MPEPVDNRAESTSQPVDPAVLEQTLFEIKRVIVGQDRAIERLLVSLLARGHCLLEGVPGLAKTLAVETLATVVGGTFTRIQFTPDLLPADIVGTRIYRASNESFDIEWGPIFANFVLADEINRAPAKVQSAMLEAMAEHQVSVGGVTRHSPDPFLVLATQNPIESEGVYPLPEAQRDRFLMKIVVGYPNATEEAEIVQRMGVRPPRSRQVLDLEQLIALQKATDNVYVDRGVVDYAVSLVMATREPASYGLPELTELITYGASPRASIGLVAAGRALALLRGRTYVLPQDVFDVAPDVLRHRLVPSYEALAQGLGVEHLLARLLSTVPAPRIAPSQTPTTEQWDPPTAAPRAPAPYDATTLSPWADPTETQPQPQAQPAPPAPTTPTASPAAPSGEAPTNPPAGNPSTGNPPANNPPANNPPGWTESA